jgi:hypothetical protein
VKSAIVAVCTYLWTAFAKPALGSVNGALIPAELKKAALAALAASTVVGGIVAAINAVVPDVPTIFTSPAIASLVTFVLAQAAAQIGQLTQSQTGLEYKSLIADVAYRMYGQYYEPDLESVLPSIDIDAQVVINAMNQNIIGKGEARELLFPSLFARDGGGVAPAPKPEPEPAPAA